jgi:hypothetical protein
LCEDGWFSKTPVYHDHQGKPAVGSAFAYLIASV